MLSVFFYETGAFHMFSLDYEDADDSHYAFQDERKLREFNLMTGSRLSEQEVFQLVHNALPAPNGPAMVREELLNVAKEAVADLENQKEQGADPSRYQA